VFWHCSQAYRAVPRTSRLSPAISINDFSACQQRSPRTAFPLLLFCQNSARPSSVAHVWPRSLFPLSVEIEPALFFLSLLISRGRLFFPFPFPDKGYSGLFFLLSRRTLLPPLSLTKLKAREVLSMIDFGVLFGESLSLFRPSLTSLLLPALTQVTASLWKPIHRKVPLSLILRLRTSLKVRRFLRRTSTSLFSFLHLKCLHAPVWNGFSEWNFSFPSNVFSVKGAPFTVRPSPSSSAAQEAVPQLPQFESAVPFFFGADHRPSVSLPFFRVLSLLHKPFTPPPSFSGYSNPAGFLSALPPLFPLGTSAGGMCTPILSLASFFFRAETCLLSPCPCLFLQQHRLIKAPTSAVTPDTSRLLLLCLSFFDLKATVDVVFPPQFTKYVKFFNFFLKDELTFFSSPSIVFPSVLAKQCRLLVQLGMSTARPRASFFLLPAGSPPFRFLREAGW